MKKMEKMLEKVNKKEKKRKDRKKKKEKGKKREVVSPGTSAAAQAAVAATSTIGKKRKQPDTTSATSTGKVQKKLRFDEDVEGGSDSSLPPLDISAVVSDKGAKVSKSKGKAKKNIPAHISPPETASDSEPAPELPTKTSSSRTRR